VKEKRKDDFRAKRSVGPLRPTLLPVRDKRQGDGDVFVAGSLVGACNYAKPFFQDLLLFSVCLCVTVVKRKNMW
jgi:hypothetical protein